MPNNLVPAGYNADMNSSENLLKVQRLLPIHLQADWAKRAQTTMESRREPSFLQMTEFVEQKAKTASNVYGQNISKTASPASASQSHSKPKAKQTRVTALSTSWNGEGAHETKKDKQVRCQFCSQSHKLAECKSLHRSLTMSVVSSSGTINFVTTVSSSGILLGDAGLAAIVRLQ